MNYRREDGRKRYYSEGFSQAYSREVVGTPAGSLGLLKKGCGA
jgi:hypothetical protein